jgi:hypothetical protein
MVHTLLSGLNSSGSDKIQAVKFAVATQQYERTVFTSEEGWRGNQ